MLGKTESNGCWCWFNWPSDTYDVFRKPAVRGCLVCEVNKDLREQIAKQYAVEKTFDNLEAGLTDSPKVVVIATPAHFAYSHGHQRLRRQAHTFL